MDTEIIKRINQLLERINTGKAGPDDYSSLLQLMDTHTAPWIVEHIQTYFSLHPKNVPEQVPSFHNESWQQVLKNVLSADQPVIQKSSTPVKHIRSWKRIAAAASVVLLITAGGLAWLLTPKTNVPGTPVKVATANIAPGSEGAILTLEDGSTVTLDSLGNGLVASQTGARAILQNGQLNYEPAIGKTAGTAWNTITIPKARQFRLSLPDGSMVWLNAATTLRFPTSFNGNERKVQLIGEAYFEVAKNARQPFRVMIGDSASVEVLGTSFNINAYTDEPGVRTTLLDGSVRVKKQQDAILLRPGQQAVLKQHIIIDEHANIEGAIAWKYGKFNFEGASLEEFMRQIARWYDIDVTYKGNTPQMLIRGKPGRDLQLQDLLDALADLGIRYQLEGRKLTIY